jgi:uncharacterized repeat protein (TIGR03803 family)
MKHSQKVFSKSCVETHAVAGKSGAAGLLLAVVLAASIPIEVAGADLTFQMIYQFTTTTSPGLQPSATLVEGTDGNFYGTTTTGVGVKGTVFKITLGGALTTLHSFSGPDGGQPAAGLALGSDGNFYGTTGEGGANGWGTVFKISPSGTFTTLASFNGANGAIPVGVLVQGDDLKFYGTTQGGGVSNAGTIFRIATNGTLTTLHSFRGPDGSGPGGLVKGRDGNFYGASGGGGPDTNSNGTIFKITTNGTLTTLVSFTGGANGLSPSGVLAEGSEGAFYGTTVVGGAGYDPDIAQRDGTVFRVTTNGTLTMLLSFNGSNGRHPYAGLIQGRDGNFYGTTRGGGVGGLYCTGDEGCGTVFKITPNGALTTLVSFNRVNGASPYAGLVQGSDGNFYGTALQGGAQQQGTIFRLAQPPRPLITAITRSGGAVTLTWTSITNEVYRVEYTPVLTATSWTALSPNVTAANSTASFTDDPTEATERYYRIVLLP